MRTLAILFCVCSAVLDQGRRVQSALGLQDLRFQDRVGTQCPLKGFASLVLAFNPVAGWWRANLGKYRFTSVRNRVVGVQLGDDICERTRLPRSGWEFWRQLGSPENVCAPMVDYSELPFRMLCRDLGTDLAYTPMIHARLLTEQKTYRQKHFDPHPTDRPLIAQLAGHDPDVVFSAAKQIEASGLVDAIDLNFGCPQAIARKGRYGAFLLDKPEEMVALVRKLASGLSIPVVAKLRMLPSRSETIELCKRLEDAGASVLTLHGRTRDQNKQFCGSADWDAIRDVVQALDIPIIANGGVATHKDVDACKSYTGCAAVMSGEALLENPALFCSNVHPITGAYLDQNTLARRYLEFCAEFPPSKGMKMIRGHMFRFLYNGLMQHPHLREEVIRASSIDQMSNVIEHLAAVGWDMPNFHHAESSMERLDLSWYRRHRGHAKESEPEALSHEELREAQLVNRREEDKVEQRIKKLRLQNQKECRLDCKEQRREAKAQLCTDLGRTPM